ncbi:MAG: LPS export ABC transporter periplasmic protein LptC [Candidatus Symbiobacter sp.]|nr:LPS export ABC transporter periplasmic protein LptC [Candidatus Symbiobacter sp.]
MTEPTNHPPPDPARASDAQPTPPSESVSPKPQGLGEKRRPDSRQTLKTIGSEIGAEIGARSVRIIETTLVETFMISKILRRSVKIMVLKHSLPFLALMIAVLVLAWHYILPNRVKFASESEPAAPRDLANARMIKPRFLSNDGKGQTYVITADEASALADESDAYVMVNPTADFAAKGNAWNYVRARSGLYKPKNKTLSLSGDVVVLRDDGMAFSTASLQIDLSNRDMTGDNPAEAHGPNGEILGQGVKLRAQGRRLIFTGAARMLVRGAGDDRPKDQAASLDQGQAEPLQSGQTLITANNGIEWQRDQNRTIAHGHALVIQNNHTVRADTVTIWYKDVQNQDVPDQDVQSQAVQNQADKTPRSHDLLGRKFKPTHLEAQGKAVIVSGQDHLAGEQANYDFGNDIAVMQGGGLRLDLASGDIITAEQSLDYFRTTGLAVARGNAAASKGDRRVDADILTVKMNPAPNGQSAKKITPGGTRPEQIDGFGQVRIATAEQRAVGDKGRYYPDRRFARMLGNVKVSQGQSVLVGDYGEVDFANGTSRVLSGRDADHASEQIKGLINPDDAKSSKKDKN